VRNHRRKWQVGRKGGLDLSGFERRHLPDLKSQIEGMGHGTVLDLEHVTLVDVEGVGFLSECEAKGIELVHCLPYIREWITRERQR
jgi:hypothetical protein